MLKNLLLLSGFSTFVVIVVVGFNIYHNSTISSLSTRTQKHVSPITPTFDKKTLSDLKKRKSITVSLEEKSDVISEDSKQAALSPSPTQASLVAPITASPSAKPLPTQPSTSLP